MSTTGQALLLPLCSAVGVSAHMPTQSLPRPLHLPAALSARLGVGKGGVRLAPDELVGEVLGLPLGSVTPLAVAQPAAAAAVCLLLDAKLRGQPRVWVHPLDNRSSVGLAPQGLEAFIRWGVAGGACKQRAVAVLPLARQWGSDASSGSSSLELYTCCPHPFAPILNSSLGREPVWVDLEAEVKVDKDNPPDLKQHADAFDPVAKSGDDAATPGAPAAAAAAKHTAAVTAGDKKGSSSGGKPAAVAKPAAQRADVQVATEAVLAVALDAVGSSTELVGPDVMRRLRADVEAELCTLRNAAYASGFAAARGGIASMISREFA